MTREEYAARAWEVLQSKGIRLSLPLDVFESPERFREEVLGNRHLLVEATDDDRDVWVRTLDNIEDVRERIAAFVHEEWGLLLAYDLEEERELVVRVNIELD